MPTTHEIQRMSADLPKEDTYIVTNVITVDAPLDFVWENLPKNLDFSQVMQPYGWLPGARTWETSENFNETGSNITYTMRDNSTIEETIIKRDTASHHYVYACLPPMPGFDFWQGNLFYKDAGNGKTTVIWRYWLKPKDNFLSKIVVARLLKLFIWKGYTAKAASVVRDYHVHSVLHDVTLPREMPIEEDEVFQRPPAIPSLAAHNEGSFDDIDQAN